MSAAHQGPGTVWLTAAQAAGRAGVAEDTWRSYVSRRAPRGNPAPLHGRRNPETGVQEWAAAEVDEWIARRPGRGARTDLA